MKVRLHAEARAELREAQRWYYERSPLNAIAFSHAVENAVSGIRAADELSVSRARDSQIRSPAISLQHFLSSR